jgi:hypothetical protein
MPGIPDVRFEFLQRVRLQLPRHPFAEHSEFVKPADTTSHIPSFPHPVLEADDVSLLTFFLQSSSPLLHLSDAT